MEKDRIQEHCIFSFDLFPMFLNISIEVKGMGLAKVLNQLTVYANKQGSSLKHYICVKELMSKDQIRSN